MARIAVIADIHGNLEAFEAVLGDIEKQKNISRIYSLGDNVGYGPSPVQVLEKLGQRGIRSIIGNHEAALMGILNFEEVFSSENAIKATYWTIDELKNHNVDLEESPFFKKAGFAIMPSRLPHVGMTHSTLSKPELFEYVVGPEIAETRKVAVREFDYMRKKKIPLVFFGHSHEPLIVKSDYGVGAIEIVIPHFKKSKRSYTFYPPEEEMWMVNVGSVGQPRDGDPRACYLIYDTKRKILSYYRIEYDFEKTADKIIKAGLPKVYASRLKAGR
jgi:predicted phosphodiesterase